MDGFHARNLRRGFNAVALWLTVRLAQAQGFTFTSAATTAASTTTTAASLSFSRGFPLWAGLIIAFTFIRTRAFSGLSGFAFRTSSGSLAFACLVTTAATTTPPTTLAAFTWAFAILTFFGADTFFTVAIGFGLIFIRIVFNDFIIFVDWIVNLHINRDEIIFEQFFAKLNDFKAVLARCHVRLGKYTHHKTALLNQTCEVVALFVQQIKCRRDIGMQGDFTILAVGDSGLNRPQRL
jgi:hypothetical protein